MVAIIATEMTDSLLGRFDDDVEPDAATLTEVVDRVRATYQSEATARITEAQRKASEEVASALFEKEKTQEEHRKLVLNLRAKAFTIARVTSWVFFAVVAVILVAGPLIIGYNLVPTGTAFSKLIGYGVTGAVWLAGVFRFLWGGHVNQWRKAVEVRVDCSLRKWFGITDTLKTLE